MKFGSNVISNMAWQYIGQMFIRGTVDRYLVVAVSFDVDGVIIQLHDRETGEPVSLNGGVVSVAERLAEMKVINFPEENDPTATISGGL